MSIVGDIEGAAASAVPGVSQAKAIWLGIKIAAFVALALWGWRMDSLRAKHLDEAVKLNTALQAESEANQATTVSLGACMANVDTLNHAANERADAYAKSQKDAAQAAADAAKAREDLKVYQARLQGMADKAELLGKCPMSDDLRAEMEKFFAKP